MSTFVRSVTLSILLLTSLTAGAKSQLPRQLRPEDLTLLTTLTVTLDSASAGTTALFTTSGTLTLGGNLVVNATGAPFPAWKQYLIIDNDGTDAIVGTFNGLPEGAVIISGGQVFSVSYRGGSGNDLVLTAVPASAIPTLHQYTLIAFAITFAIAGLRVIGQR